MKNKKILGLLAIASCVMLGGCNGGNDPQPTPDPTPDPTPVVEVEIRVSTLPAVLVEGDVLDLDEYVTVVHASSYSVELAEASKAYASVDGHKITVTGEGDISFVVKAGDKSKECSFVGMSAVRAKLTKAFEECTTDYSAVQLIYLTAQEAVDFGEGTEEGYYAYDFIYHGEGFVLDSWFSYDEQGNIPGGFVDLGDNEIYAMVYDQNTGKFVAGYNTVYPSYYMDFFNPSFPIDFSSLKLVYDDESEEYALRVEGEDALNIAEGVFFVMNGQTMPYSDKTHTHYDVAEVSAINFYLDNEGTESDPLYCAFAFLEFTYIEKNIPVEYEPGTGHGEIPETEETYVDDMPYILDATNKNFDNGLVKAVKKVVGKESYRPAGVDYFTLTGLSEYMSNVIMNDSPSYMVTYNSYWTDNDGNVIEAPELTADYSFLKVSTSKKFVSKDGYISYKCDSDFEEFGDVASGLVVKDDKVYDVEGEFGDLHGYVNDNYSDPLDDLVGTLRLLFTPGVIENNLVPYEPEVMGTVYSCPEHGILNDSQIEIDPTTKIVTHGEDCGQVAIAHHIYAYELNLCRQNSFVTALCNGDPVLKNVAAKFTSLSQEGDDFWSFVNSVVFWDDLGDYVTLFCSLQFGKNEVYNFEISIIHDDSTASSDAVASAISNLVVED